MLFKTLLLSDDYCAHLQKMVKNRIFIPSDASTHRIKIAFFFLLLLVVVSVPPLANAAKIVWGEINDSRIQGYRIYYSLQSKIASDNHDCHFEGYTEDFVVEIPKTAATEIEISADNFQLIPGNTYHFVIRSFGDGGIESCDSNEGEYTVPYVDEELPSVPENLTADPVSDDEIELYWDASTDNVEVKGYFIYRDNLLISNVSDTFYHDTGLSPSTTYEYSVAAYDDGNNFSANCTPVMATTEDYRDSEPPTQPTGLSANSPSEDRIDLIWQPSEDNIGVAGYDIYRDGELIGTSSSLSYSDTGLLPSTTYVYGIAAFDDAGNYSSESSDLQITTMATAELKQIDVRVCSSNDDAEESVGGRMNLTSSDLELVEERRGRPQVVGIRFAQVDLPKGALIESAYIEFETDEYRAGNTSLTITAEEKANPIEFSRDHYDVSNRPTISRSVDWDDIEPWRVVDQKHHTPDIATLLEELIEQDGWSRGNAMVFIINGNGVRTVESYDGERDAAPLLHIEYR